MSENTNTTARQHKPPYILPAEWQPQSGIQLTWPHAATDWLPYLEEITATFLRLAGAIAEHEKVLIAAPDTAAVSRQIAAALPEALRRNIVFAECPTNDTWARDHAPLTLVPADGHGEPLLLDFKFNGWGEKFESRLDNAITGELYRSGKLHGGYEDHNDFVLEGGSVESDGRGTIFTTTACLLAPHRNQPLTQADITARLCQWLRAERVVWLDHGCLIGDDTDGHIDTIVRCAPDDTLLYVGCDSTDDPQHDDFARLEQQLRGLRTLQGTPYRLLRLPMPDAIYDGDDRLPATYANFVIVNGAVIVPTYGQPEKDRLAMDIIGKAFPGRRTVGIDATTVVRQHGSLHCLTMQYPQGVM